MNAAVSLIWARLRRLVGEIVGWETDYWYFAFLDRRNDAKQTHYSEDDDSIRARRFKPFTIYQSIFTQDGS